MIAGAIDYTVFFFSRFRAALTRSESSSFAFCSFALRAALRFFPARLIKNVSILIPEAGPFGETLFDASERAMVSGSLVNNPSEGCVESVVTRPDHFLPDCFPACGKFPLPTAESFRASEQMLWRLTYSTAPQCLLKYCTARSCCFAFSKVEKVPRLRRLPVLAFFFLEYSRNSPDLSLRIMFRFDARQRSLGRPSRRAQAFLPLIATDKFQPSSCSHVQFPKLLVSESRKIERAAL